MPTAKDALPIKIDHSVIRTVDGGVEVKSIGDAQRYGITKDGRIWSFRLNRWLHPNTTNKNAKQIWIVFDDHAPKEGHPHAHNYLVARLVAAAWVPNPHQYIEVNHIDNNRSNNVVQNLEWVTHRQNMLQMFRDYEKERANWHPPAWTPEQRAKLAAKRAARPEWTAKIVAASRTPEARRLRSEVLKKFWASMPIEERNARCKRMRELALQRKQQEVNT